ncbi:helix-turn-helix transcriptional regulator, partial [Bacillus cereus]|uniref:helix-turn-helix transcriptional regulator n=1 Tax=Bacillus cereus TaxID=1396 RepID=UPI0011455F0E
NKYVGSKIKDYRKSFGLSQEELAKKIGVGKTTISNYEVGIRSPKKPQMIKLSEVFGITIDDFFPQTAPIKTNVSATLSEINKIS